MKKLLTLMIVAMMSAVILLFSSCSKTPQQKAEELIKEVMLKNLYHPDTYAPSSTQLDSAYTPYDDPTFYQATLKLAKLAIALEKYDNEMSSEKRSMALWSDPYQSAYGRANYQEAKKKYDIAQEKFEKAKGEAKTLGQELAALRNKKKSFIGFKAVHGYRANNNAGQTMGGNMLFIFDKDLTKVIATYDMDKEDYQAVEYFYKEMRGETSMSDDVTLDGFE